ncbi:MAG: hypothetical protein U1F43_38105 [Myxococcota bacterium]
MRRQDHARRRRQERLLEAQRGRVVLVVVLAPPDGPIAARLVEADRRRVVLAHLEAHGAGAAIERRLLGRVHEPLRHALAARACVDGDAVEARHVGAAPEQDQAVAEEAHARRVLGHQHERRLLAEQRPEAGPRHAVAWERLRLEAEQRLQVGRLGAPYGTGFVRRGHQQTWRLQAVLALPVSHG